MNLNEFLDEAIVIKDGNKITRRQVFQERGEDPTFLAELHTLWLREETYMPKRDGRSVRRKYEY